MSRAEMIAVARANQKLPCGQSHDEDVRDTPADDVPETYDNLSTVKTESSALADSLTVIKRNAKAVSMNPYVSTKKVAAYCRVSTDLEEQESSLDLQMQAYKWVIENHAGWELAGIYVDEGLTGTNVTKRIGFQRMIKDASEGKIDVILAKSISRFARNTQDALLYTRYLQRYGVNVYFEKEGIDTAGFSSEFMLTILAAFAQEESHSISENTKRGIRNRFKMGIPMWSEVYGLKEGWKINEEEAKTIRLIFDLFTSDKTPAEVAEELNKRKIPTPGSTKKWNTKNVGRVLTNEKYVGDVLMQKTYVNNFMEHKSLENGDALVEQYYKRDHHEGIVSREQFNKAQNLYAMINPFNGPLQYPYFGVLKCPCCGRNMIKIKVGGSINTTAWTCGGDSGDRDRIRLKDRTDCPTYLLQDEILNREMMREIKALDAYDIENKGFSKEITNAQYFVKMDKKITFKMVDSLVESITMDDWDCLIINWKMGYSTMREIKYEYLRETILPIFGKNKRGQDACFGNFVQRKDYFLERFRERQQRVLQYEIYEPPYGDCKVPRIISPELKVRIEEKEKEKQIRRMG